MGGSKSSGKSTTTVRYASYIENRHSVFLSDTYTNRVAAVVDNPYTDYEDVEVEDAFFGAGYTIASFPSLYDMYGKFMAGLDIEVLWAQTFEDTVNNGVVDDLISAESALMDDDIETNSIPRIQTGMRDVNSVLASTYPIARAVVEDAKVKALTKFSAELKYRLISVAQDRWSTHLQWNQQVVTIYSEIMKFYYAAKHDVNEDNYAFDAKCVLWPFTVLEFERAALGALQGATNTRTDAAGASTTSRVLSGALSGAAMGAMVGNTVKNSAGGTYAGWGAVAGAAVGVAAALTY